MLRGEKSRSKTDARKEQPLMLEIAHDLRIDERAAAVDRQFAIGVREGSCVGIRFHGIGIRVGEKRLRSGRNGRKEQK